MPAEGTSKDESRIMSLRVPVTLAHRLELAADVLEVSMSKIVRESIEARLDAYAKDRDFKAKLDAHRRHLDDLF